MLLFMCRYCEECEAAFLLQSERTRTRTRVKEEVVCVEIQLLEQTSELNAYQMALTVNFLLCIFRRRVLQHAVEVLSLFSLLQMMILLITRTHSSIKRTAASIALFCIKPKRIHAREQLMMMMMMMVSASEGGVDAAAAVVVLVVVAVVAFAC